MTEVDDLYTATDRLISADPDELLPRLWHANTARGRLVGSVYRASFPHHRRADPVDRQSILALDAARHGDAELAHRLANPPRGTPLAWQPRWTTDGRLRHPASHITAFEHFGEVWAVEGTELDGRQVVITAGEDDFVHVVDLDSGDFAGASFDDPDARVRSTACATVHGRQVAVLAGWDGALRLWDLATREQLGPLLKGHTAAVAHVACTQIDGRTVAVSAGADHTVRIWHLEDDKSAVMHGHTDIVWRVACAVLDGRPIAVTASGDGTIRRWDLRTATEIGAPFVGHGYGVRDVACAELHGRPVVVSAGMDSTVRRWDLRTGEQIGDELLGHQKEVAAGVCTEVDGRRIIVSAASDCTLRVWDLESGTPLGTPLRGHNDAVWMLGLARRHDRPVVVSAGWDGRTRIWDLGTACAAPVPKTHEPAGIVKAIATTTLAGRGVAVTGSYQLTKVWDLATGLPLRSFEDHPDTVEAVVCTELDGVPVVVTAGRQAPVRAWRFEDGTPVGSPLTGHAGRIGTLAASVVDGRTMVVTGGWDDHALVWDLRTGERLGPPLLDPDEPDLSAEDEDEVRRRRSLRERGASSVVCTSVEGRPVVIVGRYDGTVRVWDLTTCSLTGPAITGHTSAVQSMVVTTLRGRTEVVTAGDDRRLAAWDLATGEVTAEIRSHHLDGVSHVACAVLGGRPVVMTARRQQDDVMVWDLDNGEQLRRLALPNRVESLAVAPTGELVVAYDHDLAVFDATR